MGTPIERDLNGKCHQVRSAALRLRGASAWRYLMSTQDLVFYSSENGDQWLLIGGSDGSIVRHQPNASSGGKSRDVPLEDYLPREQNTPQGQALKQLLSAHGHV